MNSFVAQRRQFWANMLFDAQVQLRQACRGVLDLPQEKGPLNIQTRADWGIWLRTLRAALWRQQSQNQQKATCLSMDYDRYIPSRRRAADVLDSW
jgi:hypothetical protein